MTVTRVRSEVAVEFPHDEERPVLVTPGPVMAGGTAGSQAIEPTLFRRFQLVAELLGWLGLGLGLAVLVVGWWLGVDIVARVIPGSVTMKANTAVGIAAGGLAIVAHRRGWRPGLVAAMAAVVGIIGWVTTIEYVAGIEWSGFDELLAHEGAGAVLTSNPGRMGANTAIDYALLGPALFMLARDRGGSARRFLAAVVTSVGFVAALGYALQVPGLAGLAAGATKMAINASVLHIALGLGILFSHPDAGSMGRVISRRAGGAIIRKFLPVVLATTVLIGLVAEHVLASASGSRVFALQVALAAVIFLATGAVLAIGGRVDKIDADREETVGRKLEVARQALTKTELELHTAFSNAPIGMSITSLDGRLLQVNSELCDMLGRNEEELLALNWRDYTHPANIEIDEAEVDRLLSGRSGATNEPAGVVEKRYIRADGSIIWVSLSMALVRDPSGDPGYFITHVQDITEQRSTRQALEEAEKRFRGAFDHAPVGMSLVSLDGRITRCNEALRRILGYSGEELCALTVDDITHPDDVSASADAIRAALEGNQETWQLEKRFIASDGRVVHSVLNGTIVRDPEGSPLYLIGQLVDISDLHEANNQLRDLLRSRDELVASVSHELRTPLTGVMGFAEVLRDPRSGLSAAERQEMITSIATQSADLANIVEDLLTAAQVGAGNLIIAQVPVDLRAQAAQVIEGLDRAAVPIEAPERPVRAVGDPARVRQILRNLVTNAVRYGGEAIKMTIDETGSSAQLEVRDNGPGIPEEKRDLIFEPYKRAHEDSGLTASVGLGLAVSRKLADLMNGELTCHRQDGETVFELTLPRVDSIDVS